MNDRYGFVTEPNIRILGEMDDFWDIQPSEVMGFLDRMAMLLNDPWPYQRNWAAIYEIVELGYSPGELALRWAAYGKENDS